MIRIWFHFSKCRHDKCFPSSERTFLHSSRLVFGYFCDENNFLILSQFIRFDEQILACIWIKYFAQLQTRDCGEMTRQTIQITHPHNMNSGPTIAPWAGKQAGFLGFPGLNKCVPGTVMGSRRYRHDKTAATYGTERLLQHCTSVNYIHFLWQMHQLSVLPSVQVLAVYLSIFAWKIRKWHKTKFEHKQNSRKMRCLLHLKLNTRKHWFRLISMPYATNWFGGGGLIGGYIYDVNFAYWQCNLFQITSCCFPGNNDSTWDILTDFFEFSGSIGSAQVITTWIHRDEWVKKTIVKLSFFIFGTLSKLPFSDKPFSNNSWCGTEVCETSKNWENISLFSALWESATQLNATKQMSDEKAEFAQTGSTLGTGQDGLCSRRNRQTKCKIQDSHTLWLVVKTHFLTFIICTTIRENSQAWDNIEATVG